MTPDLIEELLAYVKQGAVLPQTAVKLMVMSGKAQSDAERLVCDAVATTASPSRRTPEPELPPRGMTSYAPP